MANLIPGRETEFLLYQGEDGRTRVEVRFEGETAWLSLGQMAELFQRDKSVISRHVANVFDEEELAREGTVAYFATVQREGDREVNREIEFYNLDVIISVEDSVAFVACGLKFIPGKFRSTIDVCIGAVC